MVRPFRVPFYPYFPVIALIIAFVSLIAMTTLNIKLALIYFGILALSYIWFHLAVKKTIHDAINQPLKKLYKNWPLIKQKK